MSDPTLAEILAVPADAPFPLPAVRHYLNTRWGRIMQSVGPESQGGRAVAAQFSAVIDELIAELEHDATNYAVVAVGGYGEGFLAPFSDVDLMILHDEAEPEAVEARATRLFHILWDCGISLGHAVRTLDDCRDRMLCDAVTATALMLARPVAGCQELVERLESEVVHPYFRDNAREYAKKKLEETQRRHEHYGDSFCMMEPNVKETKGGQRDYSMVLWLARAVDGLKSLDEVRTAGWVPLDELDDANHAIDRLWLIRCAMHILRGKKDDRFDLELQAETAARLGYSDTPEADAVECLMKEHYLGAKAIYRFLRHALDRYRRIVLPPGSLPMRRKLSETLTLLGDSLYPEEGAFPGKDPVAGLMEPFIAAVSEGYGISDALTQQVRQSLHHVDDTFRSSSAAARQFLDLLTQRAGVARALRAMHWAGLLGKYLPEFGELDCLANFKVYHDYTVDEHTLMAVARIDELYASTDDASACKRSVLDNLAKPWLLRLAILLHDAGKSRGPSHEERGATMVTSLAVRLGLDPGDAFVLRNLVMHHLLLARTAGMRDFSDPDVVARFVQTVGDTETLDLLYLLTYADIGAVGRNAWPAWQDALVTQFYKLCRAAIEDPSASREPTRDVCERILAELPDPALHAEAAKHLAMMRDSYLYEVTGQDVAEQIDLIRRAAVEEVALTLRARNGTREVWIATRDRPRRFAQLAGTLTICGFNIVSAQAHTRRDGMILDRFLVTTNAQSVVDRHALEMRLRKENAGGSSLHKKVRNYMRRVRRGPTRTGNVRVQVKIDNELSKNFTVIDVIAEDCIGLLFHLSECLADYNLDIGVARVTTKSNIVTDVFYVTDSDAKLIDASRIEKLRGALHEIAS